MPSDLDHKDALVHANRELVRLGLNQGTAGNVSLRVGQDMLITPTGLAPERTDRSTVATLPLDGGGRWWGSHKPSSEWRLHLDILNAREDVGAVVHTHSPFATVLAVQQRAIPAVHYMIAAFNGATIQCTPYVPFGTQALSDLIIEHLGPRHGVLLGNHGAVATGTTLEQAVWRAAELEALARLYCLASQPAPPVVLSDDEIARTIERFSSYGMTAVEATGQR